MALGLVCLLACGVLTNSIAEAGSASLFDWGTLLTTLECSSRQENELSAARVKFLKGICHANIGQLAEAFDELQDSAKSDNRQEIAKIVQENRPVAEQDSKDLLALNIVAFGELVLNHIDESIEWFEKIIIADPHNIWPRNVVSILYGKKQDLNKAIWHLEQALKIDPKNEYSHLLLAVGYKEQKQFGAAVYHYLQARNVVAELRKFGVD